jgi:tetratricopeptide (TPR) repeat protein
MKELGDTALRAAALLLPAVLLSCTAARADSAATPAQLQIDAARAALSRQPGSVKSLDSLAVGLTRRARETGDTAYYEEASKALEEARRLDPGSRQTLRISAWVAMGRHEFDRARRMAREYDRRYPGDFWNLGVLGDSLMELGRYGAAEISFQEMADLRPGPAAYSRIAYWRETRGDLGGAMEMMRLALSSTEPRETEDRAWLTVQIAHLQDLSGEIPSAEASYREALSIFPGYHYALAGLAELALRLRRPEESESLARRAIQAAPHAERYLILADALRAQGREAEARDAEGTFELLAGRNADKPDNENHDLVLFYLERRPDLARALAIARREAGRRRDIHTLDRLAIAEFAAGEKLRGRRLIRRVLEAGTRDPLILAHASAMGLAAGALMEPPARETAGTREKGRASSAGWR